MLLVYSEVNIEVKWIDTSDVVVVVVSSCLQHTYLEKNNRTQ